MICLKQYEQFLSDFILGLPILLYTQKFFKEFGKQKILF